METLTIRIKLPDNEQAVDWKIEQPHQTSFHDVLEVIRRIMPHYSTMAFEYIDEDGDWITVRSNDELNAMISWHLSNVSEEARTVEPLVIHPRVPRTPGKRNVHGLRVNTGSCAFPRMMADHITSSSVKLPSGKFPELISGDQLNGSLIENLEVLGYGNGGTVYRSIHKPTRRILALKVIALDVTDEQQKQIMSELQILHQCNSPAVIEFYGAFFIDNKICMCTEYMNGGSLHKYSAIPEHVLGRIAVTVVRGLNYLWSMKILHRDLKPSNILINTSGNVKLCDFGASTQLVNSIARTYVGTNAYLAPERVVGAEYGTPSEVWSLGLSLLEMATGRFPYCSVNNRQPFTIMELMDTIVTEPPPKLPSDKFSLSFVDFVEQCMQKVPHTRPSPEALMQHEFLVSHDDNNIEIIAKWLQSSTPRKKSAGQS